MNNCAGSSFRHSLETDNVENEMIQILKKNLLNYSMILHSPKFKSMTKENSGLKLIL